KFTGAGGEVRVRARAVEEGVHFVVSDNGPGVPPDDLTRLFDRHWRAAGTAHMGAGLGLAISKGIIEAHGGRIWAESRQGAGTHLHFIVPRAQFAGSVSPACKNAEEEKSGANREDAIEVAAAGPGR